MNQEGQTGSHAALFEADQSDQIREITRLCSVHTRRITGSSGSACGSSITWRHDPRPLTAAGTGKRGCHPATAPAPAPGAQSIQQAPRSLGTARLT